jgi:SEC-C motif-containing protein
MRSRYTAYAKHEMNWLKDSLAPKDRAGFDLQSSQAWAQKSEWLGLTIVKTDKGGPEDSTGQVEFIARFAVDGQTHDHHEISTFSRVDGEWFFVDGKPVKPPPFRHETPKVGRNDACPCGSGKKYKKCCGK